MGRKRRSQSLKQMNAVQVCFGTSTDLYEAQRWRIYMYPGSHIASVLS